MRPTSTSWILFSLFILASLSSLLLQGGFLGDAEYGTAVNCSGPERDCFTTELDHRMECQPWYVGMPRDQLECNSTSRYAEEVALVTDPANYVTSKMGDGKPESTLVEDGMGFSWDIEFLPDGSALITQRKKGVVLHLQGGEIVQNYTVGTDRGGMGGLLGLAVDTGYENNSRVYLFYTYENLQGSDSPLDYLSRISRFRLVDGELAREKVLVDEIPGEGYNLGGRLEIGPDRKLYATVGDSGSRMGATDAEDLQGKILRINPDGSIPAGNPFGNYVYSLGHKNPQGLAWTGKGKLYSSEHGPWRRDEINHIRSGGVYGWPDRACSDLRSGFNGSPASDSISPEVCLRNWTLAPSGMEIVKEGRWKDQLFQTGLRGQHLRTYDIENGSLVDGRIFYIAREADRMGENFSRGRESFCGSFLYRPRCESQYTSPRCRVFQRVSLGAQSLR